MERTRKTYVEFFSPGLMFGEKDSVEVESRDIETLAIPDNAYAFRFYDVLFRSVEVEGEIVELKSKRVNESPLHYYGGKVYTLDELKREFPDERILIQNIEGYRCGKAIHTRKKDWWQPFNEGDVFVEAT